MHGSGAAARGAALEWCGFARSVLRAGCTAVILQRECEFRAPFFGVQEAWADAPGIRTVTRPAKPLGSAPQDRVLGDGGLPHGH